MMKNKIVSRQRDVYPLTNPYRPQNVLARMVKAAVATTALTAMRM
jgi:hypothetical protein